MQQKKKIWSLSEEKEAQTSRYKKLPEVSPFYRIRFRLKEKGGKYRWNKRWTPRCLREIRYRRVRLRIPYFMGDGLIHVTYHQSKTNFMSILFYGTFNTLDFE